MDPALPGQEPKMTGPQLHTLEVGSASHEDGRGSCQHSLRSQHSFTSEQSAVGGRELSHRLFRYDHLDRKLKREHITGIAFSGTVGIGFSVTSGRILAISGSAGLVLGFACAGIIVISVMRSLAEMVSARPIFSALIDYPHTFVDEALGFATGVIYTLSQCLSMAFLISATAAIPNAFVSSGTLKHSQTSGIVIGLFHLTLIGNSCGVRVSLLAFTLILINVGVGGYPTGRVSSGFNYTENAFPPGFSPSGFRLPQDSMTPNTGIPGSGRVFLTIWTSTTLAVFAYMGGDIVIVSAGEAQHPRRDLPAATRFMYLAPIILNILGCFVLGFNINYSDPDLSRQWLQQLESKVTPDSPFLIVLMHSSIAPHVLPTLFGAFFMFSAWSAANTALFVSSRTLFATVRLYGTPFLKRTIGLTNTGHTSLAAIFCCSLFCFVALLGLSNDHFKQPMLTLSAFFVGSIACIYAVECFAFLRSKKGLAKLEEMGRPSRNDPPYRGRHYRGHWQPMFAIVGLIGCVLITLFSGWSAIYILKARANLVGKEDLKPNSKLAWDLVGAYAGPVLYASLYFGYKMGYRIKLRTFEEIRDKYQMPQFDKDPDDIPDRGPRNWKYWLSETWSLIK